MSDQIKEVKHDIKTLTPRQTEMELHNISVAAILFKDCGKKCEIVFDEKEVVAIHYLIIKFNNEESEEEDNGLCWKLLQH